MAQTKVIACTCTHRAQDQFYGKGNRLANRVTKEKDRPTWRCTVCTKEKAAGE